MSNIARCIVIAASLVSVVGCTSRDPYWRNDVWRPPGANAANIAAMAANPYDLIRGRGDGKQLAKEPADAVTQTWTVKSSAGGSSGGSSGGASGGTGGGTSSGG